MLIVLVDFVLYGLYEQLFMDAYAMVAQLLNIVPLALTQSHSHQCQIEVIICYVCKIDPHPTVKNTTKHKLAPNFWCKSVYLLIIISASSLYVLEAVATVVCPRKWYRS